SLAPAPARGRKGWSRTVLNQDGSMRLGAFFIALCMVLIAGSAGVALYFTFGVSKGEALTAAVGLLGALAIYNIVSIWRRTRAADGNRLAELARGTADVARQVA